ncbi:MAG: 1-acyl-sn-glycerol-3-phosphate acyltransferase, partial [Sphingomonadales bacterium]|nr:1-acyl-sn-glycerol-3-phosphate acyltransferase [Sphingomonadaceae bacterium]MBS3930677.1 1-acyl-sn-glycerol-3-phosphate acyltransferase [Sphingomonadales bacterium]
MGRLLLIPRNLAFYAAFYGGSVFIVLISVAALFFSSRETFVRCVHSWSLYHRWCARHLLGITIKVEGTLP